MFRCNGGVFHCLVAGGEGRLCKAVELARFLLVKVIERIEVLQLAGEARLELRCIELCNKVGPGNSVDQAVPVILEVIAKWRQGPNSCNYYTF
jgi:hypothetical protein